MSHIVGRKLGMTQIFTEEGKAIPVTVIEAKPGTVVGIKTLKRDGYESVQVGFFEHSKEKHHTKAMLGVFKKAGVDACRKLREFPLKEGAAVGDKVTVEQFAAGDKVAVTGTSKGKGFQGAMKRQNFKGGPASHGSMFKRAPGSIGASASPSRVFKGKRMPGQMGNEQVTVKNLTVVDVRAEQNLILIKGAVPGSKTSVVEIRKEGQ
ncbi:MAG: 50S ribosomal protein L3 [Thermodesulfovibrionales bacterium]|nr:50S ribosomal protein L3 [Thermodesulfovibrionales bacterium]